MNQKKIEQNTLQISILINIIITLAGFFVYRSTKMQALFLDFFFSFIALLSSFVAIFASRISKRKTKSYPHGLYFLEPLYAILKSLMTLFLLIFSVTSASINTYKYFSSGIGTQINTGPILPYTISMVVLCFGLSYYSHFQNKRINNISTILSAESKNSFIDGLQSFGVGIAVVLLYFININSPLGFLHFTGDFFITVILALFSVKEPIKILIASFKEFSGAIVTDSNIKNEINLVITKYFEQYSQDPEILLFKTGMKIKVDILLNEEHHCTSYNDLTALKDKIEAEISQIYQNAEVNFRI